MTTDRYPEFAALHAMARAHAIVCHERTRLTQEQRLRDETGTRRRLVLPREGAELLKAAGVALHSWRAMGFEIEGDD